MLLVACFCFGVRHADNENAFRVSHHVPCCVVSKIRLPSFWA